MRAAIFARVSTAKEDQEHGLVSQIHACERFLAERGLSPEDVAIFREQASGRKADRPVLKDLVHEAAMHQFSVLVVFRLDRLTRGGISEMFRVLKALQGYGVRIYSVSETWWDPDAPTAELVLAILAWAAAFESRSIGERVQAGIAARRAEAADRGERFLWGRARVSKWIADPSLAARAAQLRAEGRSWSETALALGVGRTTARRLCQIARMEKDHGPREDEIAIGGPSK